MEKELSALNVELADVAKEIKANVIFDFNSIKATLTQEDLLLVLSEYNNIADLHLTLKAVAPDKDEEI